MNTETVGLITIARPVLDQTLLDAAMKASLVVNLSARDRLNFALTFSNAAMEAVDDVLRQTARSQAARKAATARYQQAPLPTPLSGAVPAPQAPFGPVPGVPSGPAPLPADIAVPTVKRVRRTKAQIAADTAAIAAREAATNAAILAAGQVQPQVAPQPVGPVPQEMLPAPFPQPSAPLPAPSLPQPATWTGRVEIPAQPAPSGNPFGAAPQ